MFTLTEFHKIMLGRETMGIMRNIIIFYKTSVRTCLQVEAAAAGAVEVACVHACVLQCEHAESRWPDYTGHEHSPALYEGPWQPHTR